MVSLLSASAFKTLSGPIFGKRHQRRSKAQPRQDWGEEHSSNSSWNRRWKGRSWWIWTLIKKKAAKISIFLNNHFFCMIKISIKLTIQNIHQISYQIFTKRKAFFSNRNRFIIFRKSILILIYLSFARKANTNGQYIVGVLYYQ